MALWWIRYYLGSQSGLSSYFFFLFLLLFLFFACLLAFYRAWGLNVCMLCILDFGVYLGSCSKFWVLRRATNSGF